MGDFNLKRLSGSGERRDGIDDRKEVRKKPGIFCSRSENMDCVPVEYILPGWLPTFVYNGWKTGRS